MKLVVFKDGEGGYSREGERENVGKGKGKGSQPLGQKIGQNRGPPAVVWGTNVTSNDKFGGEGAAIQGY